MENARLCERKEDVKVAEGVGEVVASVPDVLEHVLGGGDLGDAVLDGEGDGRVEQGGGLLIGEAVADVDQQVLDGEGRLGSLRHVGAVLVLVAIEDVGDDPVLVLDDTHECMVDRWLDNACLRHRHGLVRDLVRGQTNVVVIALGDRRVARDHDRYKLGAILARVGVLARTGVLQLPMGCKDNLLKAFLENDHHRQQKRQLYLQGREEKRVGVALDLDAARARSIVNQVGEDGADLSHSEVLCNAVDNAFIRVVVGKLKAVVVTRLWRLINKRHDRLDSQGHIGVRFIATEPGPIQSLRYAIASKKENHSQIAKALSPGCAPTPKELLHQSRGFKLDVVDQSEFLQCPTVSKRSATVQTTHTHTHRVPDFLGRQPKGGR